MTILITGGAGYIGSHCVTLLQQANQPIVVVDTLSNGHRPLAQGAVLEQVSILNTDAITALLLKHQVTAVMHFAAFAYVGESCEDPSKYYHNNVLGTLSLLDAMRAANVNQLIFSSTCATYGIPHHIPITEDTPQQPVNPYGYTKLAVEHMLRDFSTAYGLKFLAFRYFNAAGADPDCRTGEWHEPETHLIPLALQAITGDAPPLKVFGTDYPTPDGTCVRDYIHVLDIAKAHIMGLDYLRAGGASDFLNIGTGNGYSVKQILDQCEKTTGKPVPHSFAPRRPGDPPELVANPAKIKATLGWHPEWSRLDTIIQTAWAWEQHRRKSNVMVVK
jgi:UDP-glucose 4-epimerase